MNGKAKWGCRGRGGGGDSHGRQANITAYRETERQRSGETEQKVLQKNRQGQQLDTRQVDSK